MAAPVVVGLIGGIASGKSTVARLLQERGALWIDADRAAHAILESPAVIGQLRSRFGDDVVRSDGSVDRRWIAQHVFGNAPQAARLRVWLEQLIHPMVRQRTEERLAEEGPLYPVVVIDAPLLIEAGWTQRCDRILFVDTPWPRRLQLAAQRGWSEQQLLEREATQLSLDQKRQQATDIVANDGSLEQLESEVGEFWRRLTQVTQGQRH